MGQSGDNISPISGTFTTEEGIEWKLHDMLPKPVRVALIEAKYVYSAVQIWQVHADTKKQLQEQFPMRQITDWQAWQAVIEMVEMNDRDLAHQERQMYSHLVIEFAEERKSRIDKAFLKAS